MFLITGFSMLSGISLYIFFKFGSIVFMLMNKEKLIKLYDFTSFLFFSVLLPYTILLSLLVVTMEALAIVGSITTSTDDDPTYSSKLMTIDLIYAGYYWDVLRISQTIISTINFISIFIIYRIFQRNRQ